MSVEDRIASYTAGLFDGEGSVQINAKKSKRKYGCKYYWFMTFQISSSDHAALQELRDIWDVGLVTNWKPKKGRRRSYNWRAYSDDAGVVMSTILPHARMKRKQLDLGLKFLCASQKPDGKLTEEMSRARTEIALQLQSLNQEHGKSKLKLPKEIYNACH